MAVIKSTLKYSFGSGYWIQRIHITQSRW